MHILRGTQSCDELFFIQNQYGFLDVFKERKFAHNGMVAWKRYECKKKITGPFCRQKNDCSIVIDKIEPSGFRILHLNTNFKAEWRHYINVRLVPIQYKRKHFSAIDYNEGRMYGRCHQYCWSSAHIPFQFATFRFFATDIVHIIGSRYVRN